MEPKKSEKLKNIKRDVIISVIILMIVFMIPILIGVYINIKRPVWETDRNFYGKNIDQSDIKVKNKKAKKFEYSTNKFKKYKINGEIVYFLQSKGRKIQISSNDYKKYVSDSDTFIMYAKRCVYAYKSKEGTMKVTITSNQLSFSPEKYTKKELEHLNRIIRKNCQNKIFVYKITKDIVSYNYIDYADDKIGLKDWKGRKVCTSFMFQDAQTDSSGKVKGKSLIMPGKYDRLYPDFKLYIRNDPEYGLKNKMLNLSAKLFYGGQTEAPFIVLNVIIDIAMFLFIAIGISGIIGAVRIESGDFSEICNHDCQHCCFYCSFYSRCIEKNSLDCQYCSNYNCMNRKRKRQHTPVE